jgi:hypothetical protein
VKRIMFITFAAVFLAAACVHADSVQRSEFQYLAAIKGTLKPDVPMSVPINRDVISKTEPWFFDMRLFDSKGLEKPYVIYSEVEPGERKEAFKFKVISFDSSDEEVTIVLERPDLARRFTGIDINTPARNFRKSLQVLAGPAGDGPDSSWRVVKAGMIFDFSSQVDLRKTTLDIPSTDEDFIKVVIRDESGTTSTGRQMRLKYDGLDFQVGGKPGEVFRVNSVTGWRGEEKERKKVYDREIVQNPVRTTDKNKNSVYDLGLVNLGISKVRFQVGNIHYHRRVELWKAGKPEEDDYRLVAAGTIYNIPGMKEPQNTFSIQASRYRYLRIKIINRDNPPLNLRGFELEWPRLNLYFIPDADRNYSLFFGSEQVSRPEYEIGNIIRNDPVKLQEYESLQLGTVRQNAGYDPDMSSLMKSRLEKTVLIVIIMVLVAALSWWLFALMRKMPGSDGSGT